VTAGLFLFAVTIAALVYLGVEALRGFDASRFDGDGRS
jgi:hypothetical protein